MPQLKTSDKAPAFTLLDQNGDKFSLSSLKGSKVLLYFYPKALTPGCTTQSCCVRDAASELKDNNIVPIGISPDGPDLQKKFDDTHTLAFTLLCDTDNAVAKAYGVWQEKSNYGKTYMGIVRSSFLIDEKGRIVDAWYKVKPEETVPNAINAL
jgi:peroxiredoxin Q/BCP